MAAIALLAYTPAHAFTLEWLPVTTAVDGYDVEGTTDGAAWTVVGSVATCQALCTLVIPDPTVRTQWRVVTKAGGWRVPSTMFFGFDPAVKATAPSLPPAPLAVDAVEVKR